MANEEHPEIALSLACAPNANISAITLTAEMFL
jgi:hypothetical protein